MSVAHNRGRVNYWVKWPAESSGWAIQSHRPGVLAYIILLCIAAYASYYKT